MCLTSSSSSIALSALGLMRPDLLCCLSAPLNDLLPFNAAGKVQGTAGACEAGGREGKGMA
jgi:hypothetical protein